MSTKKGLTGKHVAMMFVGGFSIIIAVNMVLAVGAVRTFPGLETKNSYVASQTFDADRKAQLALGWDVSAQIEGAELVLRFVGPDGPVQPKLTQTLLGRTTERKDDRSPEFAFDGDAFVAKVEDLAPGRWELRLRAVAADGTLFRQRIILRKEAEA